MESQLLNNNSDSNSNYNNINNSTTHSSNSQRLGKTIKKTETINVQHLLHLEKDQRKKLTKEQKFEIQRLKNKDAAQKSRDQKKMYVESMQKINQELELEIIKLKQQISHCARYCWKCRMQLDENKSIDNFENIENQEFLEEDRNFRENIFDDSFFERVPGVQRSSSGFISYLFLATILMAVLIPSSSVLFKGQTNQPNRLLQQIITSQPSFQTITPQHQYPIVQMSKSNQMDFYQINKQNQTMLKTYFPQHSRVCIKNLLKRNLMNQSLIHKNLRLISGQQQKDVLFCHMPKIYKQSKSTGFLSRIFDIILQADEIQKIGLQDGIISLQQIPYSGLYSVSVQIRSIRKYGETEDCLMQTI